MPTLDPRLRDAIDAYFRACEWMEDEELARCAAESMQSFDGTTGRLLEGRAAHGAMLRVRIAEQPGLQYRSLQRFGGGPEVVLLVAAGSEEQLWAFRFNEADLAERITILRENHDQALAPGCWETIEAYFRTYNEDDEEAHIQLLSPELLYFGSVSRMTSVGIPTARGVFRGARDSMGVHRITPQRFFGRDRDAAVLMKLSKADPAAPQAEGVLLFHFDARSRIERLSILWNPEGFAAKRF